MKKVWGILLSMILIIGLTACGNTDTAQEEASAPAAENTSAAASAAEEESVSATAGNRMVPETAAWSGSDK